MSEIIAFLPWFIFALIYGLIVSLVPGPVGILCLRYALAKDLKQAFLCLAGLFTAELFYVILVLAGYHLYLVEQQTIFKLITMLGGLFVILVGIQTFFTKDTKTVSIAKHFPYPNYLKSLLITLCNPAIILILVTALKPYNDFYTQSVISPVFFLVIELGSIFYYLCLIYLFYKSTFLQTKKMLSIIDKVAGILLILIGVIILI